MYVARASLQKILVGIDDYNNKRVDRATSPLLNLHESKDGYSMKRTNCRAKHQKVVFFLFIIVAVVLGLQVLISKSTNSVFSASNDEIATKQIIIVTPTFRRATRLPDLVRLKNTLLNVKNIYWIIVEDGNKPVRVVERMLQRSGIPFTYLAFKTKPGYPRRGWYQRDAALKFLRDNARTIVAKNDSVLYFADDDNSYEVDLFDKYIRNVKKAGVWAVGLVGGAPLETPLVKDDKVMGWHVSWNPARKFAVDMAGFAVSVQLIFKHHARFGTECKKGGGAPETCFLEAMKLTLDDMQPFGFKKDKNRELMVWHTQTVPVKYDKRKVDLYGYIIE